MVIRTVPTRNTADAFQTFLKIADRSQWIADSKLRHNLVRVAQALNILLPTGQDNGVEVALFRYFLTQLANQKEALSHRHLQAFCDEPRLKAAQKHRYRDLANPQESEYFLLGIAFEAVEVLIGNPDRLARSLEKYLNRSKRDYSLRDHIATDLLGEIKQIYSDWFGQGNKSVWYQLKRISEKQLREKLRAIGVSEGELLKYGRTKVWLYKAFTNPDTKRRWPDPTEAQYAMAAHLYNLNEAGRDSDRLSVEEFRERVDICVKAIIHRFSFEEIDEGKVSAPTGTNLLDRAIEAESEVDRQRCYGLLEEIIEFLDRWLQEIRTVDPILYQITLMRYGAGMSQQKISSALELSRDKVRTRCSRIYRQALASLQASEKAHGLMAEYDSGNDPQVWENMVEELLPISARRQFSSQDPGIDNTSN